MTFYVSFQKYIYWFKWFLSWKYYKHIRGYLELNQLLSLLVDPCFLVLEMHIVYENFYNSRMSETIKWYVSDQFSKIVLAIAVFYMQDEWCTKLYHDNEYVFNWNVEYIIVFIFFKYFPKGKIISSFPIKSNCILFQKFIYYNKTPNSLFWFDIFMIIENTTIQLFTVY